MSETVAIKQNIRVERASLLVRLEAMAPMLLAAIIVLWVAVVFAASVYKYVNFGQGYDQIDFEQAIWNTTQGHVMEDSRFNFTGSVFGMDWMPMLFFFVPVYAVIPSAIALFFLQIVASALGAVPVYWIARDKLGSKVVGLGAAMVFLLYPTLLHTALNPFQVRLFAVTLLLFAFYYFEKGNWKLFALTAGVAMLARTDVSLVVAMFGIYALLTRRKWPYVIGPLVAGLGYFAISTFLIVPAFAYPGAFSRPAGPVADPMACWPCGTNPIVAYYGHLGSSGPEILSYIVTHPVQVAQLMFTGPKIEYILSLLLPLAFLPLLAPRLLVLVIPTLVLNLLSLRASQFSYKSHYSLLMIPGLFAAAIYGADNLRKWITRWRERRQRSVNSLKWVQVGALVMAAWALFLMVPLENPLAYANPVARAFLYPEPKARVAAARELIAMVGQDKKVAVSSKLSTQLIRAVTSNFPPAPYSPYNFDTHTRADYVNLNYILVDTNASALDEPANQIGGKTGLEALEGLPEWHQVAAKEGIILFAR